MNVKSSHVVSTKCVCVFFFSEVWVMSAEVMKCFAIPDVEVGWTFFFFFELAR